MLTLLPCAKDGYELQLTDIDEICVVYIFLTDQKQCKGSRNKKGKCPHYLHAKKQNVPKTGSASIPNMLFNLFLYDSFDLISSSINNDTIL